jgi:ABC-type lipoprotein release transport system permease subunit
MMTAYSPTSNWPLWRMAWRRIRRRPLQYVLFILGVAIGVAMMVSIDLANVSARRAFALSTDAITGRTTHRIVAANPRGVDDDLYRRVRQELGFAPAAPVVEAYVLPPQLGGRPMRLVGIDPFQQMTAAFELNLTALSLLALVVGMFLIYNTVSFSVVQRRPLFGILRCLGVTGGQLFGLIVGEAAVLGLIGSLLGVGLGVILGQGMVRLVTQTINDLYFVVNVQDVAIPPLSLLRGLLIGVAAALLAAAVPAREAMKTAPQSTLRRSTIESNAQRLLPWLVAPGWR